MDEHILVVDDDIYGRKLLRVLLNSAGYRNLSVAESAEEALDIIERSPPHLILLDIALPGMDGLTLVRRLRLDADTRNIPVIALSASVRFGGTRSAALSAGCDRYFPKPFDAHSLLDAVSALLERPDDA